MKLAPQVRTVLNFLLTGRTLSRVIADTTLGIAALPRRVSDLEAKGFAVTRTTKRDFNEKPYTSYSMTEEQITNAKALLPTAE